MTHVTALTHLLNFRFTYLRYLDEGKEVRNGASKQIGSTFSIDRACNAWVIVNYIVVSSRCRGIQKGTESGEKKQNE